MKKLFSLTGFMLFLLALSSVSCEKKDKAIEDQLIGKWNVVTEKYTEYKDNVKTYEGTDTYGPGEMVIEFFADGTGKIYEDGDLTETFDWKINGDLLAITSGIEGTKVAEFNINKSTMTLKISAEGTFDGVIYKAVSDMVLIRD
jgi:hypothetical protein